VSAHDATGVAVAVAPLHRFDQLQLAQLLAVELLGGGVPAHRKIAAICRARAKATQHRSLHRARQAQGKFGAYRTIVVMYSSSGSDQQRAS